MKIKVSDGRSFARSDITGLTPIGVCPTHGDIYQAHAVSDNGTKKWYCPFCWEYELGKLMTAHLVPIKEEAVKHE